MRGARSGQGPREARPRSGDGSHDFFGGKLSFRWVRFVSRQHTLASSTSLGRSLFQSITIPLENWTSLVVRTKAPALIGKYEIGPACGRVTLSDSRDALLLISEISIRTGGAMR